MPKFRPVTLLLTATITPPQNCPDLKRNDPLLRLKDYCDALRFYLRIPENYISKIVFVENSGSDLSQLRQVVADECSNERMEFLEYRDGNNYPPEYGKGYGEMSIINYALDNSKVGFDGDMIWKATGRLILSNIKKLIESTPADAEIYCDLHDSFRFLFLKHFFDPRFYAFTRKSYENYFRLGEQELRGSHIEYKFYHRLKRIQGSRGIYLRFKSQPQIKGHVGSVDDNYSSLKKKCQRAAQQLFRILLPNVWL